MSVYVDYSDDESTSAGGVSPRSHGSSLDCFDVMASISDCIGALPPDVEDTHEYKIKDKFNCNLDWFANVHAPIPIPVAMKIPKAKAALDKEWAKLEAKSTWNTATVRPRAEVIAECRRTGKKAHFGSLMDLCGKKNSQLSEEHWIFKGRVVFRGDCVKDEEGFHAVFSLSLIHI